MFIFYELEYMKIKLIYSIILLILLENILSIASETGIINGIVSDSEKIGLPGVQLILENQSNNTIKIEQYSDASGNFSFKNITPGIYKLTANMMGFETATVNNIVVKANQTTVLSITMQYSFSSQESITVLAERPILNPKAASIAQEITQEDFSNAPLQAKRFQEVLPLIPTVVRGPDGLINMNGARASENALLVNGSNVIDPVTGTFAMELPIEAIQTVQTYTNSYSAEYGKYTGGIVKIETLAGKNKWQVKFNDFAPRLRFRKHSIHGIEAFTPRLVISGPIISSKLFISQALNYNFVRTTIFDLKVPDNETKYSNFNSLTQLDYVINERNNLTLTFSLFPQSTTNFGINQLRPPEVSPKQEQFGWNLGSFFRHTFNDGSILDSIFSIKRFDSKIIPDSDKEASLTTEGMKNNYFNKQTRNSYRYAILNTYTFKPIQYYGEHITKIGAEINYITYEGESIYYPINIYRSDNSLSRRIVFTSPKKKLGQNTYEWSTFIQDSWTINTKITLDSGFRIDGNTLIDKIALAPRIAAVISPFLKSKTLIRAGIGIFYDKLLLNAPDFVNLPERTEIFYPKNSKPFSITYKYQLAEKLKLPYSITYNIELDQPIFKNTILRINYMQRKGLNELIVSPENDILLLSNNGSSLYKSLELTLRYDFKDSFIVFSYIKSITKGDLNNFAKLYGDIQNPVILPNYYSYLETDNPHRVLIWGVFHLPYKFIFSPVFEYHTGFPYSAIDENYNYVNEIQGYRFPNFAQLDIRLTKNFAYKKYEIMVGFKVYNILDRFNPRDVINNINSPNYGKFYNYVVPQFRGVFEILWQ
jgi:hypothetical protein